MLRNLFFRSIQFLGISTLLTFALLFFALGSVAYGLSYLARDLRFDLLLSILTLALFLCWLMAGTKLPGWVVGLLLIIAGALFTFLFVGDLWSPLKLWLQTGIRISWQRLGSSEVIPEDTNLYWSTLNEINLRTITMLNDLNVWIQALISWNPVPSYYAISLVWGYSIWLVSLWAGWFQRRREKPIIAIMPAGILLAGSLGYTYGDTKALYTLIFAVLALTGLTFYFQRERSWKTRNMDFPEEERSEKIGLIFGITLGFVFASALIPQISIRGVIETFQKWVDPQVEEIDPILESFGLEQEYAALEELGTVMEGGLPREHLIGSGPELSEIVVMSVQIKERNSDEFLQLEDLQEISFPLYWRGITYDLYSGYGWESSDVTVQNYKAGETNINIDEIEYQFLAQEVGFVESSEFIYAVGEIVTLDSDYSIAWRIVPGITETLKTPGDFFIGSQNNSGYRVESAVPMASIMALRDVQELPPAWVLDRYLALPANLSPRVIDLARELTNNAPTTYEKAVAIESYLRTYEYELNLPAPPKNRELSEYFLFELLKGYCDYYATSMVVLARASGVPARIAIGYTKGTYDSEGSQFIVSEENAHSWVEIYFAGIGWIPFEPTPAQPIPQRPIEPLDHVFGEKPPLDLDIQNPVVKELNEKWWLWSVGLILVVAIFPLLWPFVDGWYLRSLAPKKMTIKLYHRLYRFGRSIGSPAQISDTPFEYATFLDHKIRVIAQNSYWEFYLQPVVEDVGYLSDIYVRSIYSRRNPSPKEVKETISVWKRLRNRLLLAIILHSWHDWVQGVRK